MVVVVVWRLPRGLCCVWIDLCLWIVLVVLLLLAMVISRWLLPLPLALLLFAPNPHRLPPLPTIAAVAVGPPAKMASKLQVSKSLSLSLSSSRSLFPRVLLWVFCLYVHLCVSVCVKQCAVYAFLFLQTFRNCYRLVLLVVFVLTDPPADGQDPRPRDVAHRDAAGLLTKLLVLGPWDSNIFWLMMTLCGILRHSIALWHPHSFFLHPLKYPHCGQNPNGSAPFPPFPHCTSGLCVLCMAHYQSIFLLPMHTLQTRWRIQNR